MHYNSPPPFPRQKRAPVHFRRWILGLGAFVCFCKTLDCRLFYDKHTQCLYYSVISLSLLKSLETAEKIERSAETCELSESISLIHSHVNPEHSLYACPI